MLEKLTDNIVEEGKKDKKYWLIIALCIALGKLYNDGKNDQAEWRKEEQLVRNQYIQVVQILSQVKHEVKKDTDETTGTSNN